MLSYGHGPPFDQSSKAFRSGWHAESYTIRFTHSASDTSLQLANSTIVGDGNRVSLRFAPLRFASLRFAPLRSAHLRSAPLRFASLR